MRTIRILEVTRPMDTLFSATMARVLAFTIKYPQGRIPSAWYAAIAGKLYLEGNPSLHLLAAVDAQGFLHGHGLGIAENTYGRNIGWVYQSELGPTIPADERLSLIHEAMQSFTDWAKRCNCVSLCMATVRNPRAMARRFGFTEIMTAMERNLED